jgi:serine/threonine-protein kinase
MLRPDGYVKVLDFGLAKLAGQHEPTTEADAADKSDISSGLVMGTVAYMSPEQALGREVDHRTDIFSLGVVMYEMAAGRRPFAGATANETLDRIIHAEPEAIARSNDHVPPELERIIRKCLEKDRERRYQSARDLVDDLRNLKREIEPGASTAVTGAPAWGRNRVGLVVGLVLAVLMAVGVGLYFFSGREGAIDSLAVLPFVNVGADPNVEVLSDGITESLINSLSQLPNLKVIARASVFQYKGRAIDPQTVGRKLNVRAVLTGQVAQHGDALFISAELMDAQDSRHLWGEQYHRPLADIFLIQEEIAKELSETLRLRLSRAEQQRLTKRYTENTQAYHLYLTGRYFWNRRDAEGMRKAIESFQQAIALDPTYALAYAGLADTYALLGSASYDAQPPREDMPKARAAATRALELDDTLAEAHSALAFVKGWYDWDWPGAERGLQRALDLNPNYATAHQRYGWYYLAMGRPEEALAEMRRAQQCDPLSPIIAVNIGAVLYYQRHYDQALAQFGKVVEMDPSFRVSHSWQGWAYAEKGAYADAIAAFQRETLPWEQSRWGLAMVYARMGKKHEARQLLNQLHELAKQRYVPSSAFIVIYAALGEKDQAFTWLERAYEEHDEDLDLLNVDPKLDSLRSDPRFAELARRVGLRS